MYLAGDALGIVRHEPGKDLLDEVYSLLRRQAPDEGYDRLVGSGCWV